MAHDEAKGSAETMVHGVVFRLEIERLRDTIMAHILDHEGVLRAAIDRAIIAGLGDVDAVIARAVRKYLAEAVESKVASLVNDLVYDGDLSDVVDAAVDAHLRGVLAAHSPEGSE